MAEGYDANRESEQARRRLTELAREIGRRSTAEYVRGEARALVDEKKGAAIERSRAYAQRARETAVEKSVEYREKAIASPGLLGLVGALVGAAIGRTVANRVKADRERERLYGVDVHRFESRNFARADYGSPGLGDLGVDRGIDRGIGLDTRADPNFGSDIGTGYAVGVSGVDASVGSEGRFSKDAMAAKKEAFADKAAHAKSVVSEKAAHAKSVVSEKAAHARESMSMKADALKGGARERMGHAKDSLRHSFDSAKERMPSRADVSGYYERGVQEQPWALALGAIGAGLLAGLFLPQSDAERRAIEPIRSKARLRIDEYVSEYGGRLEGLIGAAEKKTDALAPQNLGGSFQGDTWNRQDAGDTWSGENRFDEPLTGGDASAGAMTTDDLPGTVESGALGGGALSEVDADVGADIREDERTDDQSRVVGTYEPPTVH